MIRKEPSDGYGLDRTATHEDDTAVGVTGLIQRHRLDNGLRIVSEPIQHVRSVSVGVWVGAGSRWEEPGEGGASHFIEHLLFKGTHNRSARQLAEAIDAVGGHMNAYTTKEYTCYYVRVLDQHLDLALELLADMLLHSCFEPAEIDKEKSVVLEEIKLYEDTPDELVHDLFAKCLWQGHPLGRAVIGSREEVTALSRREVLAFFGRHYRPQNTVIAVAGHFDPDRLAERVQHHFGAWPPGPLPPRERGTATVTPQREIRVKETEQVHFCVGTEGRPLEHHDLYALLALGNLLGGGSSSRLFQEIREERGLAYAVYSFQAAYRDTGVFGIYAGSSPETAGVVLELVIEEIQKVRRDGISDDELVRAKEQLKSGLVMSMESTSARMSRLGKGELLLARLPSPDEVIGRVDAVVRDDVLRLAHEILSPDHLALAAVAPTDHPFEA